jgi:hypothetical protein
VNEKGNGPTRDSKFFSAHRCSSFNSARVIETGLLPTAGSEALSVAESIAATETMVNMQRMLNKLG